MKPAVKPLVRDRVTRSILNSILFHLAEPDLDLDHGELKLVDQDEACVYFGLFETDEVTGNLSSKPSMIWTVEVSADVDGGR